MKKNEFKCPKCSLPTKTTNTRKYENGICLRRRLCKTCNTAYVVIYKNGEEKVVNTYKPTKCVRIKEFLEEA